MTEDVSGDPLHRYREIRRKIDPEVRFIQNLTGLLAKFEHTGRARLEIDPVALGLVHASLQQSAINIRQVLDDCLPAGENRQPAACGGK